MPRTTTASRRSTAPRAGQLDVLATARLVDRAVRRVGIRRVEEIIGRACDRAWRVRYRAGSR